MRRGKREYTSEKTSLENSPVQMSGQAEIEQLQKILVYFPKGRHNWVTQLMYHWGAHQHDYEHRVPSDEYNVGSTHVLRKPNCERGHYISKIIA